MTEVEDESVHLIITSPPYWQLKDYGNEDQIGFHQSYEDYINNLNLVWNESGRVLHKGCRLCINIGDQFARAVYYGRYKVIPIRTEMIKFCESAGFDYLGAIIWQKVTTTHTTGGATIMGSFPYPRNGILKIDYEFILIFKKHGKSPKVSKEVKEKSRLTTTQWNEYFSGHWNFAGEKQNEHLAMFPLELPSRLIKMFSFTGETVLDPFTGSGTTNLAAGMLNRNSIGYEINSEFREIMDKKLAEIKNDSRNEIEYLTQEPQDINFNVEWKRLPYIFHDPVKFDKKVDPRELRFGSRIDNAHIIPDEYHRVKEILSPELLILDNDQKIRLLGVKARAKSSKEAVEFLATKTRGQKLFFKFDDTQTDENDNLLCYLYLQNKTFLNAHLIKADLVDVDTSREYRYKSKFENYLNKN
jgi:site-specific DNA-methyltransferase (adenine-specific)